MGLDRAALNLAVRYALLQFPEHDAPSIASADPTPDGWSPATERSPRRCRNRLVASVSQVARQTTALHEFEASAPLAASLLHWPAIAVVGPWLAAALAGRPFQASRGPQPRRLAAHNTVRLQTK
jgi:hypothetical protein